ncbi:MAG: glycosyltransferase family 4 protein [bacterium]
MNILILCNKSPWPPKEGGPIAMNMIIEGLISAGHQVKVVAVNSYKYNIHPDEIPDEYRKKTRIELIDVDLRINPWKAFLNLFSGRSYHVERFISSSFRKRLIEILKQESFDIVQFETLYVSPYLDTIRNYSGAPIVLRAHNIEHLIWSRVAESTANPVKRWYIRHLAKTLKNYEHSVINRVDGIAAITENDAEYFRHRSSVIRHPSSVIRHPSSVIRHPSSVRIVSIPFGIDLKKYPAPAESTGLFSLCTIGAMNWIPNAEGVKWFLHHVWPDLHKEFPELRYYLAGREMPEWMLRMEFPGVVVLGEVEDAREFISGKGIIIVPLFSGSGIRIKIIEGMAAGKPIISTRIGAEGIDCTNGKNILIANAPCEFVELVTLCLHDEIRCRNLGKEARVLVETTYDQAEIIRKLIHFYQQLSG